MAEAAAAAARQARVAHLSIDAGALEGGAEGGGLHAFEAASQELQSPIAAVRQGAEATLMQLEMQSSAAAEISTAHKARMSTVEE